MAETFLNFEDFIDELKRRSPIEDVIEATGSEFKLNRRPGTWLRGEKHDSLQVNVVDQFYKWWSASQEGGDVFNWLMNRNKGMTFMHAVEYLAQRSGLTVPRAAPSSDNSEKRQRQNLWDLVQETLSGFLHEDPEAWAYVTNGPTPSGKPRYFDPKIIKSAGLGFTGRGEDHRNELIRRIKAENIDPESPAAVAIVGFRGDVAGWCANHNIPLNSYWVGQNGKPGYIGGLMAGRRIVYPHFVRGHVEYFSARNIFGSEFDSKGAVRKSYNLIKNLVGEKAYQLYFNGLFNSGCESLVLVEGPGDAIALEHMDMPAAAALGLGGAEMIKQLKDLCTYKIRKDEEGQRTIYLGIDADNPAWETLIGKNEEWPMLSVLGPMARLLRWENDMDRITFTISETGKEIRGEKVKDANDYLASYQQWFENTAADAKKKGWRQESAAEALKFNIIDKAKPLVLTIAKWAGEKEGADKDKASRTALQAVAMLEPFELATYKNEVAARMGINQRELNNMLKAISQQVEKAKTSGEPIYTWGGFIEGWLIEYLYDIKTDTATLAWRDPEGKVGTGDRLEMNGRLYLPYPPNDSLRNGAILFPSAMGEHKEIAEIIFGIDSYLKKIYIFPSDRLSRLVAYWILTTWIYDSFETCIYLRATGPAGAGKSELMKRIGLACYRMMTANGAGSTSALFRSVERYRGVVFIDEADIPQSDTENDMVKFYNLGAMKNNPIWRTVEVTGPNGERTWEMVSFQTFCPKLVAMRKDFKDDAVGSRSLTLKLVTREMTELMAAKIPLTLTNAIRDQAQAIRNVLLRWRLENWQPEIEVDAGYYDLTISPRLNQVSGPMLAIAKNDEKQQEAIKSMLREYYAETILHNAETKTARVLEALWQIWQFPDLREEMVKEEGEDFLIKIGDVTKIANKIMDQMNSNKDYDSEDDDDEPDENENSDNNSAYFKGKKYKSSRKGMSARTVGGILRNELQLQGTERRRDGFWIYWNEPRILGLSTKYGVNPVNFSPSQDEKPKTILEKEPGQVNLL